MWAFNSSGSMNRRLLRAVGLYSVVLAGLTVGLVYVGSGLVGAEFGLAAVIMVVVGLIVGPLMFARAGTSVATANADADGDGMNTFDEPENESFLTIGRDTPLKAALGLYLLGVTAYAALGLVFLA